MGLGVQDQEGSRHPLSVWPLVSGPGRETATSDVFARLVESAWLLKRATLNLKPETLDPEPPHPEFGLPVH